MARRNKNRKGGGVRQQLKSAGDSVSRKELKQISRSTGASLDKVVSQANKQGYGLEQSAVNFYNKRNEASNQKAAFLEQALGDIGLDDRSLGQKSLEGAAGFKGQVVNYDKEGNLSYSNRSTNDKDIGNLQKQIDNLYQDLESTRVEEEAAPEEDPYSLDFESFFQQQQEADQAWAEEFTTTMNDIVSGLDTSMGDMMSSIQPVTEPTTPEPGLRIRGAFDTTGESVTALPDEAASTSEALPETNTGLGIADATGATGLALPETGTEPLVGNGLSIGVS
jgi:hypothetical protein